MDYYHHNESLRAVIDLIGSGIFTSGDRELFKPIIDSLLYKDPYMLFADYQAYIDCQDRVGRLYADKKRWTQMSILNTARMGKFSSDRSIKQYCQKVWDVQPCPVKLKWNELPEDGVLFHPGEIPEEPYGR
jgi:starch phosphorylase